MSTNHDEQNYFRLRQAERQEAVRRERELAALRQSERDGIAATLTTSDEVADEALALGFSEETAPVIPLVPLIAVAWADGRVSVAEKKTVLSIAAERGIAPESPAYAFLDRILEERPSELFFQRTHRVIAHMLGESHEDWDRGSIVELARRVAASSGGLFGLAYSVSGEEESMIERVARELSVSQEGAGRVERLDG